MKVHYLCHAINEPCGGLKVIYQHVDILNELGNDAAVYHEEPGFRPQWFANDTKIIYEPDGMPDVVTVPWMKTAELQINKILFIQNPYYINDPDLAQEIVSDPYVKAIFVVSKDSQFYMTKFIKNFPVYRIPNFVNTKVFKYSAEKAKHICINGMKNPEDYMQIITMLKLKGINDWTYTILKDMTEKEVAKELKKAAIFIQCGIREGLPLPPMEAMACGCFVIGYNGMGGHEFMINPISHVCNPGDTMMLFGILQEWMRKFEKNPAKTLELGKMASDFITLNYNRTKTERALVNAYSHILRSPRFRAKLRTPAVLHERLEEHGASGSASVQ